MVKCAECGFLAIRNVESRELEEAEKDIREHGCCTVLIGQIQGHPQLRHTGLPLCFAGRYDLWDESKKETVKGDRNTRGARTVIHKQRRCEGFTKWQLGFTPKEHREMIDRQWERKWRIITGIIFIILAGLFTLLGAFIANLN